MAKEDLMVLSKEKLASVEKVFSSAVETFMMPEEAPANVIGVAQGVKWSDGKPTGKPALLVLVTHKVEEPELSKADLVPPEFKGVATDVLNIGVPIAGGDTLPNADVESLAKRARPAQGGYSVGHYKITAGTIATSVYDMLPGGTTAPPSHGAGIPSKFYILSNNHVLANCNDSNLKDAILQPGPYDGGTDPADRIGTLSRFIPLTFEPPIARNLHNNLVDAAIAEVQFHDVERQIYWSGAVRGWRRKAAIPVGTLVKKTGRTTNFTTGRITAINATVDVGYGGGKVARLQDQFISTAISAGGDSGSLVTTLDNVAVGLLFAGSSVATIFNPIENVRSLLRVEVAEQML